MTSTSLWAALAYENTFAENLDPISVLKVDVSALLANAAALFTFLLPLLALAFAASKCDRGEDSPIAKGSGEERRMTPRGRSAGLVGVVEAAPKATEEVSAEARRLT